MTDRLPVPTGVGLMQALRFEACGPGRVPIVSARPSGETLS